MSASRGLVFRGNAVRSRPGTARQSCVTARFGMAVLAWFGTGGLAGPGVEGNATQSRTACLGQAAPGASWQSKAVEASAACLVAAGKATQRSQGPSRPGLAGLDRSWMVRQSRWSRQVQFGQRTFRQSWLVEVLRGEAS